MRWALTRIQAEIYPHVDRLEGLGRNGVDEISYERGHLYFFIVVDHDTGRLVSIGGGSGTRGHRASTHGLHPVHDAGTADSATELHAHYSRSRQDSTGLPPLCLPARRAREAPLFNEPDNARRHSNCI